MLGEGARVAITGEEGHAPGGGRGAGAEGKRGLREQPGPGQEVVAGVAEEEEKGGDVQERGVMEAVRPNRENRGDLPRRVHRLSPLWIELVSYSSGRSPRPR